MGGASFGRPGERLGEGADPIGLGRFPEGGGAGAELGGWAGRLLADSAQISQDPGLLGMAGSIETRYMQIPCVLQS